MRLRTGFAKLTWLFTLVTAVVLATNAAAYNGSDFQKPPDWLAHGNDRSNPGYGSYEPINVIISGNSSFDLVNYLQRFGGWYSCYDSNLQANVQPSGRLENQLVELRESGCQEWALGGNHLRAWRQNLPGGHWDYFIAVSEEHDCWSRGRIWHCIDPVGWNGGKGGFNQGRNDFVADMRSLAALHRFGFNSVAVDQRGLYRGGSGKDAGSSNAGNGWDYVTYDGQVAIITVR